MKASKFILSSAAFVTATLFRVFDLIGEDVWMQTVLIVLGVYSGANIGATIAHSRTEKSGS